MKRTIKPIITASERVSFDTLDRGDLRTIGLILDQPGYKLLRSCLTGEYARVNSLGAIVGDAFKDGKQVGRAECLIALQAKLDMMEANARKEAARDEE